MGLAVASLVTTACLQALEAIPLAAVCPISGTFHGGGGVPLKHGRGFFGGRSPPASPAAAVHQQAASTGEEAAHLSEAHLLVVRLLAACLPVAAPLSKRRTLGPFPSTNNVVGKNGGIY